MTDNEVNKSIIYIQKQFLCGVPVREIKWNNIFAHLSWEKQESLLKHTIFYERNLLFPIRISYQKAFVKTIIENLEKQKSDIHDVVFDAYGRLVALPDLRTSYKHYITGVGKLITLQENASIISEGTTGLCTWQAGIALAEWCFVNKHKLMNKTVLELGSGIGLASLTAALFCHPKQIYITDCHITVLETLCNNININIDLTRKLVEESAVDNKFSLSLFHKSICAKDATTLIDVLDLPWANVNQDIVSKINPDLIIAADVVYDSSVFLPLINAFEQFLTNSTCQLILACTQRNDKTMQDFLNLLEKQSFVYEEFACPEQNNFIWSTESPIRFFAIIK